MGPFDESQEQPPGSEESRVGVGKDVLYGWLVGRAAADLCLAQALAQSKTQLNEQIKRLEDNLLGQMRELHAAQIVNNGATATTAEIDSLNAEIERVSGLQRQFIAEQISVEGLEAAISAKLREFEEPIQKQLQNTVGGALNQQLTTLSEKVAALSNRAEDATARQATQSVWVENIEKLIAAHLRESENRLSVKLAQLEKSDVSLGQVQRELNAVLNRVAQIELTHRQPAAQWVQGIEESLSGKIQELRDYLAREQQDRKGRDAILNELRGEMQLVVQRLAQAEANAQQSHALMVNEAVQAAQLRDQMIGELSALQAQISLRQERDSMIEGLGTDLPGRIHEVQNQQSQKLAMIDGRDGEIAELKNQVHQVVQLSTDKSPVPPTAVSRPPSPIAVNVGLGSFKLPAQAIPASTPMASVSESSSVMPSHQAAADGPKDETKQLRQRLSADIQRARAELRKRAGAGR